MEHLPQPQGIGVGHLDAFFLALRFLCNRNAHARVLQDAEQYNADFLSAENRAVQITHSFFSIVLILADMSIHVKPHDKVFLPS